MTTARLPTLDRLRGMAVMGILLMNIVGFALPSGAYFNPLATGGASRADLAAWAIAFVFVDGKMRALFSILFGASMLLVVARAADAGRSPIRAHGARLATLAVFGVGHWVLWPGDILLHYALIGLLALPFAPIEPRRLVRLAIMLLIAQAVIQGALLVGDVQLRAAAALPHPTAAAVDQWRALAAGIGIGRPQDVLAEIATHRGAWPALAAANLHAMVIGTPFLLLFDGPETLAYMLIGMAALSSGFLTGEWRARRYARVAALALGIGLSAEALLAWVAVQSGFDTLTTFAVATLGGLPVRAAIALGYAAVALPWLGGDGALRRRIGAVGRAALSNYLLTSIAMTVLFDGWGLGLFGSLLRTRAYLLVPVAWAAMLAWSAPWLARHRYGPFEWLWRSAARGRLQPMRIGIATV